MKLRAILIALIGAMLAWSFWQSRSWLQLCGGLAMFLFGMQLLEEGLRQLAGGRLERWLTRSTETPWRGFWFGVGGTMLLQSTTLVSLLTIAFISTGLIQLAGGLAIIFGANLGATSGVWLLALAGHDFSLSPLALPLLVFGVLASFNGAKSRAAGRVLLGIAFIFLGIDQIKVGFAAFGGQIDLAGIGGEGFRATLLFAAIGMVATLVLQSSHATLMLTLAAIASGQLQAAQGFAVAIGANLGSAVTTSFVGMLGGNRSGQRLALAHALFNGTTATVALATLPALTWISEGFGKLFGANALLQLAMFHTLFNVLGVALFWPWQKTLTTWLERWLPEPPAQAPELPAAPTRKRHHARYLTERALESVDAATAALAAELRHFGNLCLDAICRSLYLPSARLSQPFSEAVALDDRPDTEGEDADSFYQHHVKGVYADLLSFMGKLDLPLDAAHQPFWQHAQEVALLLVNAVKDAKHLQKNLGQRLREDDAPVREVYLELRRYVFGLLHALHEIANAPYDAEQRRARLAELDTRANAFESGFRQRLFGMVKSGELDGLQTGSLMNDLGYAGRIFDSLREAMQPFDEPESLQLLRKLGSMQETAGTDVAPE